jgi:hypothetical protein
MSVQVQRTQEQQLALLQNLPQLALMQNQLALASRQNL